MYNRYIPRSDGSYQKSRIPEPSSSVPVSTEQPTSASAHPTPPPPPQPMMGFLRRLLPRGFDTGDLMVVLLILLMAGDCEEERSNAILTLALYFFL